MQLVHFTRKQSGDKPRKKEQATSNNGNGENEHLWN